MEEKQVVAKLLGEENILRDKSPVDCPFVQELPGEIECRSEIPPTDIWSLQDEGVC